MNRTHSHRTVLDFPRRPHATADRAFDRWTALRRRALRPVAVLEPEPEKTRPGYVGRALIGAALWPLIVVLLHTLWEGFPR